MLNNPILNDIITWNELFTSVRNKDNVTISLKSRLAQLAKKTFIYSFISSFNLLSMTNTTNEANKYIEMSNYAIIIEKLLNLTNESINKLIQGENIDEDCRNLVKFLLGDNSTVKNSFFSYGEMKYLIDEVKFTDLTTVIKNQYSFSTQEGIQDYFNKMDEEDKINLVMRFIGKSIKIKAYSAIPAIVTGLATTAILLYFTSVGALYSSLYGLAALALFLPISLFQWSMYQDLSTSYKTKGYAFDIVTTLLTTITVACPALIVYGNLLAIPSTLMITLGVIAPLAIGFLAINLMQRTVAKTNFKFSGGVDSTKFSPSIMAQENKVKEIKDGWTRSLASTL